MSKALYIAEKPSVAQEFAKALKSGGQRRDGYIESDTCVVTWCVGHLVTMSYPEKYDMKYKRWSLDTLPFLPHDFKYEVIPGVEKQFQIVKGLLNRPDIDTIYVCTDSGREGEYIYRLVAQMAGVKDKTQKRVWIDSQTEEEILRGIREAKDISEYDNLAAAAYLRAKEDYLMGINFSRVLTLRYGNSVTNYLGGKYQAISVGRVMTCVLGMVVRREREIRAFVKTPFYRVVSSIALEGESFEGEWRAVEGSRYFQSPVLYKENGFKKKEDAQKLICELSTQQPLICTVEKIERKKENKNPPLLFNLAELQNVCSKLFKISPDETLSIVQDLYEKKLVTYPRTDARVLSTAVAKEIYKNISGLRNYPQAGEAAQGALELGAYKNIAKTRYTNDKQITDHYAIIPTGQGYENYNNLPELHKKVYKVIVSRFLAIFYPPAEYNKIQVTVEIEDEKTIETFNCSGKVCINKGFLEILKPEEKRITKNGEKVDNSNEEEKQNDLEILKNLKKGQEVEIRNFELKEAETSPPTRYNSGSIILAMENAGKLIEEEELREQIKGAGIGTSATRAEIMKKLEKIKYIEINTKTQIITPTKKGELIYDIVYQSMPDMLNPKLTASWEKGLDMVAKKEIEPKEFMGKLEKYIYSKFDRLVVKI